MSVLKNSRHERFAQELAKGKTATEAYELAGYKANSGNAATLKATQSISKRLEELFAQHETIEKKALEKASDRLSISKEWVLAKLVENVERALQQRAVLDDDGNAIGEFRYDGNVVNRALELIGKEHRMFVERKEVGAPGEFEAMSVEALRELIARELSALGADDLAAALAGRSGEAGEQIH